MTRSLSPNQYGTLSAAADGGLSARVLEATNQNTLNSLLRRGYFLRVGTKDDQTLHLTVDGRAARASYAHAVLAERSQPGPLTDTVITALSLTKLVRSLKGKAA